MSGIYTTREQLREFVEELEAIPRRQYPEALARFIASCDAPAIDTQENTTQEAAPAVEKAEEIAVSDAETEPEA